MNNLVHLNKLKAKIKQPHTSSETEERLKRIKESLSKINQLMGELRYMGLNTDSINKSK